MLLVGRAPAYCRLLRVECKIRPDHACCHSFGGNHTDKSDTEEDDNKMVLRDEGATLNEVSENISSNSEEYAELEHRSKIPSEKHPPLCSKLSYSCERNIGTIITQALLK